jgi:rubrerythrin
MGCRQRKVVAMMNVFDFAMEMEEESRAYYEKLAAAAKKEELKTIFTLLAESEAEHYGHLELLKGGTDAKEAQSVALERVKDCIHELVGGLAPADILEGDYDGYRHAIGTEEASIKLYDELADKETNPAAAELLRRLAEEERHHLEVMENIYDFVETPRTYLEWGEFSNLREY